LGKDVNFISTLSRKFDWAQGGQHLAHRHLVVGAVSLRVLRGLAGSWLVTGARRALNGADGATGATGRQAQPDLAGANGTNGTNGVNYRLLLEQANPATQSVAGDSTSTRAINY
jgi:hypothetical protein